MTRSTNMEHVEVLRQMRDTGDVSDWRLLESALDAAIASLSAPQPASPSAPVGAEDGPIDASDNAEYIEHCADRLERCGLRVTAGALRVIAHEHRTLAQQPAAVDGAMVERACKAAVAQCAPDEVWPNDYREADDLRAMMQAALAAALAAQQGEES